MKTIGTPYSKTQMSNVESWLRTGDGDDIAVVNSLPHGLRVLHFTLGDKAVLPTTKLFLLLGYRRYKLWMCFQCARRPEDDGSYS